MNKNLISIIIPVYNEEITLLQLLSRTLELPIEKELIVVNDCSTDRTARILQNLNHNSVRIMNHDVNKGKGAAIQTGLRYASGDITVIQDADLELDPLDIINLIRPICENKTEVVYGVRVDYMKLFPDHVFLTAAIDLILGVFFILFFLLYGYRISDVMTCYKVMPTQLFKSLNLKSNGFEVEAEITAKLLKKKIKILELPVRYSPRYYSDGKKIKWYDTIKVILTIIKCRFIT